MKRTAPSNRPDNAVEILVWADNELKRVRDNLRRAHAPKTLAKLQSTLKSLDGAIRNARRFQR